MLLCTIFFFTDGRKMYYYYLPTYLYLMNIFVVKIFIVGRYSEYFSVEGEGSVVSVGVSVENSSLFNMGNTYIKTS